MKTASSRIGSIDLLKFLLAICIVILHSGQTYGGDSYHLNMGGIAVEMFFIISGCLMCMSAEKAERKAAGASSPPSALKPSHSSAGR